jgi:peroxiredoxin
MADPNTLPDDLPVPVDDGAADHLPGAALPAVAVVATSGETVILDRLGRGRSVLCFYPLTGRPGVDLPDGWDSIPGARGCTTEACDFRDHHADLLAAGARIVYGVSSQDSDYQRELVDRLSLPFSMLADPELTIAGALALPTFTAAGQRLYRRLTLIVDDGRIEHVFYPIFPPMSTPSRCSAGYTRTPPAIPGPPPGQLESGDARSADILRRSRGCSSVG